VGRGTGWKRRTAIVLKILFSLDMCAPSPWICAPLIATSSIQLTHTLNTLPYHEACHQLAISGGHVTAITDETTSPAYTVFKTNAQCVLPSPLLLITSKTTLKPMRPFYLPITTTTYIDFSILFTGNP
jgi:hypothetical protein